MFIIQVMKYVDHYNCFDIAKFCVFCRQKLESLLKIVRCEVISFVRNDQVDAYVLRWVSLLIHFQWLS
jgi:hypothetical protein